ncbi:MULTISPECIES: helix-turn-helix transcriptional regulator [Streptosporangium]|uniref:DNA-binding CsgD family transcriptional regulator n=2 Tax=Streptosporangium TaxID=2000 RepID=A0A852USB3_9ACTN|nr:MULTISPECIES: helix-turn-helix transcriptional regulator [Streptosporangium]NYF38163.1 DNA-binding CsgD family transcriptional regulator [Streptosporangium sandarakinum]GGQ18246.1 transcriptional regulator [Streptosporangium pseudovulgare]
MDVSVIGISPEAVEIYRYFLRHRGEGVDSVPEALGLDPDLVESTAETLGRLGLLDLHDRHRVVATEPRIGIERLVEKRLNELNAEVLRVLAARDAISVFMEDKQEGERAATALDIERVEGADRVRQRLDDLAFFSYKETLCLHPGGPFSRVMIESALPLDTRSLRRGLSIKGVYHPKALEDAFMLSYLRELVSLGGEVRITEQPMDRMLIYDRSVAVVPIDPKESARGALLVREPGLVSQLVIYFEGMWKSAVDLREFIEPSTEQPLLSEMEQRVLEVMATADKDEIAARELDISVRTYRRYVADLMARLGAVNRFQAALRAKEENWI